MVLWITFFEGHWEAIIAKFYNCWSAGFETHIKQRTKITPRLWCRILLTKVYPPSPSTWAKCNFEKGIYCKNQWFFYSNYFYNFSLRETLLSKSIASNRPSKNSPHPQRNATINIIPALIFSIRTLLSSANCFASLSPQYLELKLYKLHPVDPI